MLPVQVQFTAIVQQFNRLRMSSISGRERHRRIIMIKDENPVPEGEIAELIAERDAKVEEIKQRYPYSEE